MSRNIEVPKKVLDENAVFNDPLLQDLLDMTTEEAEQWIDDNTTSFVEVRELLKALTKFTVAGMHRL